MKIGSEGRGPPAGGQFRRVSRAGTSSVVAAYTSRPRPLERSWLIRVKAAFVHKKSPQSVDTERGNGYNTYRVRPKRSAENHQVFSLIRE